MPDANWLKGQSKISLERLLPSLQTRFAAQAAADPDAWHDFNRRLTAHFDKLFNRLMQLYGERYDFFYHLECILSTAAQSWMARPTELKALDDAREVDPRWFQSQNMLGGVCYVDIFAGDLSGIQTKIHYFKELGLTYLHLMPLFQSPDGDNDGGYAVSSYREVKSSLGTMDQLAKFAAELRRNGISLVLDFVFNHTSDEHDWARRALAGEIEYQEYYIMFPDRQMPDAFEAHTREIFPDEHAGTFTHRPEIGKWVWTTFHTYQWDLNYANPVVFNKMAREMLFLANVGAEVLRLDAAAFIWKKIGTSSENLPQAHAIIQALNALTRIAAPSLLFKSEAIVHPDEVNKYIDVDECQLSYNPLLMAMLWNSLATHEVRLLREALRERFEICSDCGWVNYVRSHDDIGWTFSDEDAAALDINAFDHRQFLHAFYTGRFEGSFARGLPFEENQKTGDARVAGTCASLAGLEKAQNEETEAEVELAIRRILLLHSIIVTIGGIPLIYLGDEVATLNDYGFRHDPLKAKDNRWVHRPYADWEKFERRKIEDSVEGRIYQALHHLIALRKQHAAFAGGMMQVVDTGNDHVLGFLRLKGAERVLVLANFTERDQTVAANHLRTHGLSYSYTDLVTEEQIGLEQDVLLDPYRFMWLTS